MIGVYSGLSHDAIAATANILRHFRAFLASSYREMRDPYEITAWGAGARHLDKPTAQRRLTWLIRVAILRKAGWIDDVHSRELAPAMNHRGRFPRYRTGDAQRHLYLLARNINQPRLIVRQRELGEWASYLRRRLPPERFNDVSDRSRVGRRRGDADAALRAVGRLRTLRAARRPPTYIRDRSSGDDADGRGARRCRAGAQERGSEGAAMEQVTKKPVVRLSGMNGNVFVLLGACSTALRRAGQGDQANELRQKVFAAGSYDEALQLMMQYVDVR